jgi:hypothetical protein
MIPGVGQDDVVRIRRSRAKLVWALAVSIGFLAFCVGYLMPLGIGAKIIGILGAVFFSGVALKVLIELVVPRDLLLIGPDGIYQRAVRPHVLIPWHEITDIGVIERSDRVTTLGVVVRNPSQFPQQGALGPLVNNRWMPRVVKLLLGASQLLYEGPAGAGDVVHTLGADMSSHATFEISTLGFPMSTQELVDLLHARWRKAVGPPRHRPRHRHR